MMLGLSEGIGKMTIPAGSKPNAEYMARCSAIGGYWMTWPEFTSCDVPSDPSKTLPPYTGPTQSVSAMGPGGATGSVAWDAAAGTGGENTTISVCRDCSTLTAAQFEVPGGDSNCCETHPAGYILGLKPATLALLSAVAVAVWMLMGGRK